MLILQLLLLAVFVYILRKRRRHACVYERRKYLVSTLVFCLSLVISGYARFMLPRGSSMSSPEALLNTLALLLVLISLSELILTYLLFRKRELLDQAQQRHKEQQS